MRNTVRNTVLCLKTEDIFCQTRKKKKREKTVKQQKKIK